MSLEPDPADDPAAPAAGSRRYVIGECVGYGGLGSVHRAWDSQLGRWVAVKRLTPDVDEGDPDAAAERLRREAHALAALQHPNIVTVHDFGEDDQGPFVVMEFIEGETLEAVAARAPLDLSSFSTLAVQTLGAVEAAHRAGLLHRDLKPGNIMLSGLPDGGFIVKVLDFGLARFAPRPSRQTLDQTGSLLGSIYFMAPEQFHHEPLDARTDLYALGAIYFYSLTGRHPFDGDSTAQVMAAHLEGRLLRPLAQLRPDVPPALAAWVERLMSRLPTARPHSAAAALALARSFLAAGHLPGHGRSLTGRVPVLTASRSGTTRGRRWPLVAGAALLLAAGAVSAFLALRRPAAQPFVPVEATPGKVAAPAPAPAVVVATPGESTLDANDAAGLRAHLNQLATVTGTPVGAGQSRTGTVFYLNFGARPHEGLAVVCFASAGSPAKLEDFRAWVGKPVRVRGKLGEFKGDLQLVIDSPAGIRPES